jgi:hypothetical protein
VSFYLQSGGENPQIRKRQTSARVGSKTSINSNNSRPARSSEKKRYTWHLSPALNVDPKVAREMATAAATGNGSKPPLPSKPRSCSADASRKSVRISCDPSNLTNPSSLEVVGKKSPLNKSGSFYQSYGSNEGNTTKPVIKMRKKQTSKDDSNRFKDIKISRSRQILRELERQLKPPMHPKLEPKPSGNGNFDTGSKSVEKCSIEHQLPYFEPEKSRESVVKKNDSPYVLLSQKNVHDMHSLVLELDNNLSFGSTKAEDSSISVSRAETETVSQAETEILMPEVGQLKSIQMDSSDLSLSRKNLVGKGTYANVYKCQLHGTDVAVKAFNCTGNGHKPEVTHRKWINEGELTMQLRHPHIVQLVGASIKDGMPLLLFEYLEGGSLHHYIHDVVRSKMDNGSFFSIARDIALALNYLHKQGFIKQQLFL